MDIQRANVEEKRNYIREFSYLQREKKDDGTGASHSQYITSPQKQH